VPTAETTRRVFDNLDFLRGVEVFLNFIPAASLEAIRLGATEIGATKSNQAIIFDQLMDSNPLFLTGNTDTVYAMAILDLETDGPTVVEVPPGSGPGTVNDAIFRFVIDMGAPGPDKGQGGKYLIVPPGYAGDLPKDKKDGGAYYVARSPSYVNWLILRGFLVDGKPDTASKMFREGVKVYPLAKADNPPAMEFFNGSKLPFNTVHANNFEFYEELDHVIQKEPLDFIDPELRGLAASIGIRKGTPFAPDERMKQTLTEAVAVGNATARAMSFRNREPRNAIYPDSQWRTLFGGVDYQWLDAGGWVGATSMPARPSITAHREYAGHGREDSRQGLTIRAQFCRRRGQAIRWQEKLSPQRPGERPREGFLVGGPLRSADALRAANRSAVPQQEQQARQDDRQRRRFGRYLFRSGGARRQGSQLDSVRPGQGLVCDLPPLRPARALVRQNLAPRRD
jgi:hypothetical protein